MSVPQQDSGPTPALLTWTVAQKKMPWSIILLLGGGFALAKGSEVQHMLFKICLCVFDFEYVQVRYICIALVLYHRPSFRVGRCDSNKFDLASMLYL